MAQREQTAFAIFIGFCRDALVMGVYFLGKREKGEEFGTT
jgi:hypothetical protein